MSGRDSPTADWLIMCIITGLLVFVTLEAGVFAVLGATGVVSALETGVKALAIITGITGIAGIASFIYTRRLR